MTPETQSTLLTRLVEEGQSEGADLLTLRAIAEEASELGAARALERLGLTDSGARTDLDELRQLLSAWRDAKRAARDAVVAWAVRIALALVMLGMAAKLGLMPLMRE